MGGKQITEVRVRENGMQLNKQLRTQICGGGTFTKYETTSELLISWELLLLNVLTSIQCRHLRLILLLVSIPRIWHRGTMIIIQS